MWDFFSKVFDYIVGIFTPMAILYFFLSIVIFWLFLPYETVSAFFPERHVPTVIYILMCIVSSYFGTVLFSAIHAAISMLVEKCEYHRNRS